MLRESGASSNPGRFGFDTVQHRTLSDYWIIRFRG
jgi:hypothetical protein